MSLLLLHILSSANLLSEQQMKQWPEDSSNISETLKNLALDETAAAKTIANYYELSHRRLSINTLQQSLSLKPEWLQLPWPQWQIIPITGGDATTLFLADPNSLNHIQSLTQAIAPPHTVVICSASDLKKAMCYLLLQQCCLHSYQSNQADLAPTLVERLLQHAIMQGASDVHIEPKTTHSRIRIRLDGILHEQARFHHSSHNAIIARLKILAKLDTNEQRLPQDGRFSFHAHQTFQCRINTCRLVHAEKAAIRLNNPTQQLFALNQLGLNPQQLQQVRSINRIHQGLILITGPTGSGKTNTLYSLLQHLQCDNINITTIENPVEIELEFLNQCNTQTQLGAGFSQLLRALLRQDPDVIMIGEIRDAETAAIAIKAALTGHLVLSTLHTNSCIATIQRLQQLDVPLADIINTTQLIIAQRLIRQRCQHCQNETVQPCPHCHQGYIGRRGLFEVLQPGTELKSLFINGTTHSEPLQLTAINEGMVPLPIIAKQLVEQGITDQAEVDRVTTH